MLTNNIPCLCKQNCLCAGGADIHPNHVAKRVHGKFRNLSDEIDEHDEDNSND
jgi:hypothetical protein